MREHRRRDAVVGEVVSERCRPLLVVLRPVVLMKQQLHVLVAPPLLVQPPWSGHEGLLALIRNLRLHVLLFVAGDTKTILAGSRQSLWPSRAGAA